MNEPILDDELTQNEVSLNDVKFAGFWIRVGASLIDFFILLPVLLLGVYNSLNFKSLPLMLLITLIGFLYKPYLEWKKGGTFGKLAVGVKVVDYSLKNIDLDQAFRRYFPWIISYIISVIIDIHVYTLPEFQDIDQFLELAPLVEQSPLNSISTFYNLIFLILVGSLIFDPRKQGVHDKYAGTYCILTK
ncbi:MAG: RDD family protein [Bacteroidetes bacterium]|nr:MAG: RDD family protein [Bacteroidota bacterium]